MYTLNFLSFIVFTGTIDADNISEYKYVALDPNGQVIDEETISRKYEDKRINEVYNRENKEHTIPELPELFKPMYPMGSKDFPPFPDNVVYTLYANCLENAYSDVTSFPFLNNDLNLQNNQLVNCTFTIVSPNSVYKSDGTIHLIGFGSRLFKKLSWGIKVDKKFMGRKSFKLRAMASDATLIREKLATGLYKAVGVPVQEGAYARVFINGDTYGLYQIMDSFSKKWIAGYIHGDPKKDIGISYKLYAHIPQYADFRYLGDQYLDYAPFYNPDEYEDKDIDLNNDATKYTRIMDFIQKFNNWINTPGQPIDELKKFFNIECTLRLMVIDTLILALDNFWLRMSNAAIYYNPERDNYAILPYDFDKVLIGGEIDPMIDQATYVTDCYTWATQHEEKIDHYFTNTLLNHPEIKKRYDVILAKTSRELFTPDIISKYVHAYADVIRDDIQFNTDSSYSLSIPYNGQLNHYSIDDFEQNIDNGHVSFNEGTVVNDSHFGINEWVELRSESCKAATTDVDTSNNNNISDEYKMKVYDGTGEDISGNVSSGVESLFTTKTTFLIILIQLILFTLY